MFGPIPPHAHTMMSIDVETTGLETPPLDAVIEVGVVVLNGGKVVDEWESLVRPDASFLVPSRWRECQKFHNIELPDVIAARLTEDVAISLAKMLAPYVADGYIMQAFNRQFDMKMLTGEGFRLGKRLAELGKTLEWGEDIMAAMQTETRALGYTSMRSERYYGGGGLRPFAISLEESCAILGIERTGKAHRALNDAYDASRVYYEILRRRTERRDARMKVEPNDPPW